MASDTIGQFGQHYRIILETGAMAIQAPAHIHLLRNSHCHLAKLAMAILTIQACCNMRTMAKINEIRNNRNRYPWNGFVILDKSYKLIDLRISNGDLLVASPAFCICRQSGRWTAQCTRVAIETLNSQVDMQIMGKLYWLRRGSLGLVEPPCHPCDGQCDDQKQEYFDQRFF